MTPLASTRRWLTPRRGFLILLAVLVVLRLIQALNATHSHDGEEGYTLLAAHELVHNHVWPYQIYQMTPWENGSRLVVLLAAPLLALLGPALLVLKLVGLLINIVTFCGLYLLVRDSYGPRPALLACLLYLFFPGPVFDYSLTAHGFHPDSVAIQLFFLWRLVLLLKRRRSRRDLLLCGALGGFAVWFAYISVIVVIAGSLVLLRGVWRQRRRDPSGVAAQALWYVAGGAIFATLLLAYNIHDGFAGLRVYGETSVLSFVSPGALGQKLSHFYQFSLPVLLHFSNLARRSDVLATGFNVLYWITALACVAWPFRRWLGRRWAARGSTVGSTAAAAFAAAPLDAIMPLFVGLTMLVFLTSAHLLEPYHLVPVLVLLLAPVSARLAALWFRGGVAGQGVALSLVGAVLAVGVPANLGELRPDRLGMSLYVDGRNYPFFFRRLQMFYARSKPVRHIHNHRRWIELPLELEHTNEPPPGYPPSFYGDDLYTTVVSGRAAASITRYLRAPAPAGDRAKKLELAGHLLARAFYHGRMDAAAVYRHVGRLPDAEIPTVLEGLGLSLDSGQHEEFIDVAGTTLRPRGKNRAATLRSWQERLVFGMGRQVWISLLFDQPGYGCAAALPPALRPAYIRGMGYGVTCYLVRETPSRLLQQICPALRPHFRQGIRESGQRCRRSFNLYK